MVVICVEMDKNKSRTDLLAAGRKKGPCSFTLFIHSM